jgi:general secretion pathway protein M
LFWAFIWQPLDKGHDTLIRSVDTWERSLAELRPLKGLTSSTGNEVPVAPTGAQQAPVVIVDKTLRARGLDRSLKRSQPTTSTGIRVEFENVAFDDLMLWLGDLSGQYLMHVQAGSLSNSSQAGPGRINATLTIERSP